MTPRPRGKRDSSENSRAPKNSSSSKRSGGRKPTGKASQRPPRVSRPPALDEAPKRPAKPAPRAPASRPTAPAKKPAPKTTRSRSAPQRSEAPPSQPQRQAPAPQSASSTSLPHRMPHVPMPARPPHSEQRPPHQPPQHQQPQYQQPRPPQQQQSRPPQPYPAPNNNYQQPPQRAPHQGGQYQQPRQQQPQQYQQPQRAPMPPQQRPPMPPQGQRPPMQQQQNQRPPAQQQGYPSSNHHQQQRGQPPQHQQPQQYQQSQRPPQQGGQYQQPQQPRQQQPAPYQQPQQQQRAPMPPQQRPPVDRSPAAQPPAHQPAYQPPAQPVQPPSRAPQPQYQPPAPPQSRPQQPVQPTHQPQSQPPRQGPSGPPRMPSGGPQNFYTPSPRPTSPPPAPPRAPAPPAQHTPAPVAPPPAPRYEAPRAPAPPPPPRHESPRQEVPREPAPQVAHAPTPTVAGVVHAPQHPRFDNTSKNDVFDKTVRFADLGLSPLVLQGVTEAGFEFPTAIQAQIIPMLVARKDMLGQAKTGTGKTAAFGLPMLTNLKPGERFSAMVLVPTRELAIQVATDLNELGKYTGLTALPVYGGQNIATQAQRLARGPEIIVATPGRVMDMQQRGYLHYHDIKMIVLDEVDRMLDIGFRDDIKRILGSCPKDRQTVFVSATLPGEVESLARTFARNAEKIVATTGSLTASLVKQYHLPVEPWDKKQLLLHLLTHESPALTLVFCRTKKTVDNLTEYLMRKGIDAHAMHGDMQQSKRNKALERLKGGSLSVLIASDLASRGLDVEGITHVINYDLPEDPDLYVHRIGRTARAGRDGVAWALVTPEQGGLLTEIEMLINAEIPKLDYPDFKPGPVPQDVLASRQSDEKRATVAKTFNRFAPGPMTATGNTSTTSTAPVDLNPAKFPGGIVPSKLPDRRLGGRVRSARSMRKAIAQTIAPPPADANKPPEPGQPAEQSGS